MSNERIFDLVFTDTSNKLEEKCPSMESLCAYLDNSHSLSTRKNIEEHLLNCNLCFEQYVFINEQNKKIHESNFTTPEWLKSEVTGKTTGLDLNVEGLFTTISKTWSWLSWSSGLAFGIVIALMLFIFIPGLYPSNTNNPDEPDFFAKPVSYQTPSEDYVVLTEYSDLYSATYHYQQGEELLVKSLEEKAKEEFISSIKYNPDYAEAHWQLARIYEKENNNKEALKHWKRFLYLTPKLGSYEEAKKHIEELNTHLEE